MSFSLYFPRMMLISSWSLFCDMPDVTIITMVIFTMTIFTIDHDQHGNDDQGFGYFDEDTFNHSGEECLKVRPQSCSLVLQIHLFKMMRRPFL